MNIAVINYTGDRPNWGCQATSLELLDMLRRLLVPRGTVRFHLFPLLPRRRIDGLVERWLGGRIRKALTAERPSRLDRAVMLAAGVLLYGSAVLRLPSCKCAFFQAEGTLDGTDFIKGDRLLILPYLAQVVFRKPVFSLNQTLYSARPDFEAVLRRSYERYRLVAVRERASYDYARQLGLEEAVLIPDAAFYTRPSDDESASLITPAPTGPYFCVSGSARLRSVAREAFAQLIQTISEEHGLKPVFLFSAGQDIEFQRFLEGRAATPFPVCRPREGATHRQIARIIEKSAFLLTGRYHMAVLAACVQTPFVLLESTTFKTAGLVTLLDYPVPVRGFGQGRQVLADVREVLARRQELSRRLGLGLERVRQLLAFGEELHRSNLRAA